MIPNVNEAEVAAKPVNEEALTVRTAVGDLAIQSHHGMKLAVQSIAEIKEKAEEVDAKRRSFVDPLRKVIDDINGFFKPAVESLKDAEKILKDKVAAYVADQHTARDEMLAEAQNYSNGDRVDLIDRATKLVPPKMKGLSIRESWTGKVTDASSLVRWAVENNRLELLKVDDKALKALTKAAGRDPEIPGWTAVLTRTTAITTSKIERG